VVPARGLGRHPSAMYDCDTKVLALFALAGLGSVPCQKNPLSAQRTPMTSAAPSHLP
jgi:hypothetical protein